MGQVSLPGGVGTPRILFASAEAFPLAKTGGLGDVCSALPAMLAQLGADIRLILPGYPQALDGALGKRVVADLGGLAGRKPCRLVAGAMPDSGLPVILVDAPDLFEREGGLYQDRDGRDWPDNHRRFAVFCQAAARVALGRAGLAWTPQIVHANDWHAGLLPALLATAGAARPKTVLTIHNLAFQGNFPIDIFPELGLPQEMLSAEGVEFWGQVSFLKAGIRYSDRLTTVSPNYAREILTAEHGCGFEGLLRHRTGDLVGILNGVDYDIWCPSRDAALTQPYTAEEMSGKRACKAALQAEIGLPADPAAPLVIFANRLTHQKMADIVLDSVPAAVAAGAQIVVHGSGERGFEDAFAALGRRYPGQVAVRLGYVEALAHRLHAAADISLTPSRFEPCGLTTMYAMRYGALPVTRAVGGLADTVDDVEASGTAAGGTGFVFAAPDIAALGACLGRAIGWYRRQDSWQPVQRRAMKRDFGWERSARRYLAVYDGLIEAAPQHAVSNDRRSPAEADPGMALAGGA